MSPTSTTPTPTPDNTAKKVSAQTLPNSDPPYTIQEIPGKGKGLLATRSIPPSTLLISESPLLTTESITSETSLRQLIKKLPKTSQQSFLFLHNAFPGSPTPFINIIRSNAYPLGPSSDIGGLFPTIARINHSCLPNAQHSWNGALGKEVVYSLREIKEGEEITLSYLNGGVSSERREQLKENFGFICGCQLCSLPSEKLSKSDKNLSRTATLDAEIGNPQRIKKEPVKMLAKCKEMLAIFEEEGIRDTRVPRVYYDAFQICVMHSDAARASVFGDRYCGFKRGSEGVDSKDVKEMEGFVKKPEGHGSWGLTGKWKLRVDDVPRGFGEEEFEKWLWRE